MRAKEAHCLFLVTAPILAKGGLHVSREMPFLEHLTDLRRRLLIVALIVLYEISITISRLIHRRRAKETALSEV